MQGHGLTVEPFLWKLTEWSGPSPAGCAAGLAYKHTTCKNIVTLRAAGLAYQHPACKNISRHSPCSRVSLSTYSLQKHRHSPCMSHALTRPSHQMAQGRIADKLDDFWAGRDSIPPAVRGRAEPDTVLPSRRGHRDTGTCPMAVPVTGADCTDTLRLSPR